MRVLRRMLASSDKTIYRDCEHVVPLIIPTTSDETLEQRRLAIRRGLARAHTAAVATLLVLVIFALGAVLLAYRLERERDLTTRAEVASAKPCARCNHSSTRKKLKATSRNAALRRDSPATTKS